MTASAERVCIIFGAGDGLGRALALRFASDGFTIVALRRSGGSDKWLDELSRDRNQQHRAMALDARKEEDVDRVFAEVEKTIGLIEVCIHNIGANVTFALTDTTVRVYKKVWEMVGLSAFLVGRAAARAMLPRGRGTIIFTGATASTRGAAMYAAFGSAMAAKRSLAQSMARELGPKGIHVAHVVVDGPIETAFVRERFGAEEFDKMLAADSILKPAAIAEVYSAIAAQPRCAWTHELDVRPYSEKF